MGTHVQSEVVARKAAALVAATSLALHDVPMTAGAEKTAQLLTAVLSSHPVQAVCNAAYYAMDYLLDSLQVCSWAGLHNAGNHTASV